MKYPAKLDSASTRTKKSHKMEIRKKFQKAYREEFYRFMLADKLKNKKNQVFIHNGSKGQELN